MGFNSPTDNSFVQLAFEGCRRSCETKTTKKEPITSDMIKPLVTKYGGKNSTIPELGFLLTCLLGFARFLRIDELLEVKLKHIKLQESHLEIVIPKSKTDPKATCRRLRRRPESLVYTVLDQVVHSCSQ